MILPRPGAASDIASRQGCCVKTVGEGKRKESSPNNGFPWVYWGMIGQALYTGLVVYRVSTSEQRMLP